MKANVNGLAVYCNSREQSSLAERSVIPAKRSGVEGSRGVIVGFAAGFLDFARNDASCHLWKLDLFRDIYHRSWLNILQMRGVEHCEHA